jgi:hypothetical protein
MEASSNPATSKGTKYVVLRETSAAGAVANYEPVDVVEAASDKAALRKAVTETGTYVAIPARSFKPTPVTISTEPIVKVG